MNRAPGLPLPQGGAAREAGREAESGAVALSRLDWRPPTSRAEPTASAEVGARAGKREARRAVDATGTTTPRVPGAVGRGGASHPPRPGRGASGCCCAGRRGAAAPDPSRAPALRWACSQNRPLPPGSPLDLSASSGPQGLPGPVSVSLGSTCADHGRATLCDPGRLLARAPVSSGPSGNQYPRAAGRTE